MKDVRDNVFSFLDDWYGRLDDIIEDLKNNGFAVLNATNEFIDVSDENDKEYVLKLGGTEKTITINKIEALDESLIPIQEYYDEDEWDDDDELASIYGGDTKDSQKAIADEMKELYLDEASHPKLGKRVKSLKGWKIYQGTNNYGDEVFRCFTPDEDRPAVGYEDWETDTLEQAISWIENYDLKASKKPTNESNKELARIAFEDILKPFNGTDIKYTDETEDAEFKTHSYVANIISTPQYVELIKKLIDSDKYEYDPDFNDYVKYTEYGQITIVIKDKYITIEVMYNDDEENSIPIKESALDESLIPITEGGIYPVALYSGADEAFIKVVNEILGGNVSEVDNLELIPALGFGGGGRYWYRAKIILDEETIVNFITEESTPEAKNLLDSGDLIINSYSDISIDCSADKKYYIDGTTLDALNDSDANMEKLDNESNIIGEAIIAKLFESEDKIIEVLKKYEDLDNDDEDYFEENLILIKEKNNDEKVIYKDNINIDMNVVITEDPNNSEYYNIYVDDDPTLFLQEPKSAVKKLKLTALDAVIDYYKAEHFSDTDY